MAIRDESLRPNGCSSMRKILPTTALEAVKHCALLQISGIRTVGEVDSKVC